MFRTATDSHCQIAEEIPMKLSLSRREIRRLRHEARTELAEARKRLVRGMSAVLNEEAEADTIWECACFGALCHFLKAGELRASARRQSATVRAHKGPDRCPDCSGMGRGEDEAGEWICSPCWGVGAIRGAA